MGEANGFRVLLVIGDPIFSAQIKAALSHPGIEIEAAVSEQSIVAALTGRQFQMVVVGGQVGRRGPLVLCDVVRIRQTEAEVVVLCRQETIDAQLADHASRQLARVHYLDLRPFGTIEQQCAQARAEALRLAQLEEDAESGAAWPALLASAASQAEAQPEPAAAEPTAASAPAAEQPPAEAAPKPGGAEVTFSEAVTEDDLGFAARVVQRTRGVDFRSALAPLPVPEGTDRNTVKLRERIRELERYLAHMAHVYAGRSRDFDGAAARIAEANEQRQGVERDLTRLREHFNEERERWREQRAERDTQLEASKLRLEDFDNRLKEAADEAGRLRREAESKEAGFAAMLKQAQDAFAQLRDQSTQALAFYERRVAEQDQQAQATAAEVARLRSSLQESTERLGALTQQVQERAELAARGAVLEAQLAEARQQAEAQRVRANELEAQGAAARAELASIDGRHAEELKRLQDNVQALGQAREASLAQAQQEAATLREALEARAAALAAREKDLAGASATLQARQQELGSVKAALETREQELQREREAREKEATRFATELLAAREEAERARTRNIEKALDARLVAVEEFGRLATQNGSRQQELLTTVAERAVKQGALVDRLLRIIEPPSGSSQEVSPIVAARRLAERLHPEYVSVARLLRRLREPPWSFVAGGGAIVALAALIAVILSSGGEPNEPSPEAARPSVAAVAVAHAGAVREEAPKKAPGEAKEGASAKHEEGNPEPTMSDEAKPGEAKPAASAEPPVDAAQASDASAAEAKAASAEEHLVLTPDERKALRKELFDALKAKRWSEAADAGLKLRHGSTIDWEIQLNTCQALKFAGRKEEAIEMYRAFLKEFPDSRYVGDVKASLEKLIKGK